MLKRTTQGRGISQALGGLPLALDQAGAYIEETKCRLADYINLYQTRREMLLKWRAGILLDDASPRPTPQAPLVKTVVPDLPVGPERLETPVLLSPVCAS